MRGAVVQILLLAGALTAAPGAAAPEPQGAQTLEGSWGARVFALEEYRLRATPDPSASEQLFHFGLDLDAAHPSQRLLFNASLGLWAQAAGPATFLGADGLPAGSAPGSLASLYAERKPWLGLFTLYADYLPGGVLSLVRLGRQATEHGRPTTFDGAYLRGGTGPFEAFVFGGRTEHFYEVPADGAAYSGPFEDWIASAGVRLRPAPFLRLEADYRLLREIVTTADAGREPRTDHSWGGALWLRAGELLSAKFSARALDARVSELSAQARLVSSEHAFGLDARFAAQPVALGELNEQEGPLYAVLGTSLPHTAWHADAWKELQLPALHLSAHLGYDGRRLLHSQETAFNRNGSRARLLLDGSPVALPQLSLSVALDRISTIAVPLLDGSGPQASGLWAVDAALSYTGPALRAELGTDYQQYQYSYLADIQERAAVRAFFAGVRVRVPGRMWLRARYQVEVFDRVLHTATLGVSQDWEAR
jgi:hypothetical protein